jgi:SPP1 gp7 family putative phage head morphogenesis protein
MLNKVVSGSGADLGITDTLGRFIPAKRRAEMLARTEIIRAHHQAKVAEMKSWEVEGVYVVAELATAKDGRVCPDCAGLEGKQYSLEEAERLIPVHPNCRCTIVPVKGKKGGE